MKLIGLAGKKKTGKDTVCKFIQEILSPKIVKRIAFADALKGEVSRACIAVGGPVVSLEYIEEHKDNFRLILQGWGTDFRRNLCDQYYWINKVSDAINKLDSTVYAIIIPDVRFMNEAKWIHSNGGRVIHVSRRTGLVDLHPSETELTDDNFPYDFYISNESSLNELKLKTQDMLFTTHQYV